MTRSGISLGISLLLWSIAYNMIIPMLPLMAFDRGATASEAGLLQGIAYAGAALSLLPAGWMADRFGRLGTLTVIWGIGALGTLLMGLPGDWRAMAPGAFLALAGAGAIPALAALAAELAPAPGRRRQVINVVFAAAPGGLLIGSSLGGVLADRWGLMAVTPFAAGVTALAIGMIFLLPGGLRARPEARSSAPTVAQKRTNWRLLLLGMPVGVAFLLLSLPSGFMTPYLRDVVGLSLTGTGITNAQLAVGQLGWSALFVVWPGPRPPMDLVIGPWLRLRVDRGTVLAIAICLGANAAFGLLFPSGSIAVTVVALLLRGALFSLQPLGMSLISEVTGEGQGLATRFSVMALIVGGAAAVAPVVSGMLYERLPALPFLIAGSSAALGMLILLGVLAIGSRQSATS